MDFSNIPTGLKIPSQIPLNVKEYVQNEATLAYLGIDDNLAFTYHDQLEVLCLEEKTIYEWREVQSGEENTGLVPVDFTYPNDLPEIYGMDYSGKTYNFFLKTYITEDMLIIYKCDNIGASPSEPNEAFIYKDTLIEPNETEFRFRSISNSNGTIEINQLEGTIEINSKSFIEEGENITITGTGTLEDPYIITNNTIVTLQDGLTTTVNGDGVTVPYSVEIENLQKTINTFPYTLVDGDDKQTIFVENGASNVVINVPDGLVNNFSAVFIQKGTGTVTIQPSGTATLNYPSSVLQNIIKGQYFWAMVEKELTTNTYYLLGSLLPV
jgi:hypothetical protein